MSSPEIRGNEWKYVKECLDTGWVSSAGPFVDRFERELAAYVGTKHAVAAVNGTAALHIALLVAGVKPDDEVIVSDLTFIAPANAVRYVGAWPVLIDADPEYWQMDVAQVERFLVQECRFRRGKLVNRRTGRRVSAILPVHILGHPVDMDPLLDVAERYDLKVIEDATESLGAKYLCRRRPSDARGQRAKIRGRRSDVRTRATSRESEGGVWRRIGNLGHMACFSFNGNKIITTGGGGMIVTDNGAWAEKARYLTTQAKDDPVEYVHNEIGYNYRLTNIQAAMGCGQLERLEEYIRAKRRTAAAYREGLRDVPGISFMKESERARSIWWMPTIRIDAERYGMESRKLLRRLAECRIQARPLWRPLHKSPPHAGQAPFPCPVAEDLYRSCLSLPCSVGITEAQRQRVIGAIRGASSSS